MAPVASAERSLAPCGTISSRITGMPALATWAAMPDPITPEPITATFLISVMVGCPGSDGFENGGYELAAADALGGERELLHFVRSEERRDGNEGVSKGRSLWWSHT